MAKIYILHYTHRNKPGTIEFPADKIGLGAAVAAAMHAIEEMSYHPEYIADEEGNLILDRDGIIDYADEQNLW